MEIGYTSSTEFAAFAAGKNKNNCSLSICSALLPYGPFQERHFIFSFRQMSIEKLMTRTLCESQEHTGHYKTKKVDVVRHTLREIRPITQYSWCLLITEISPCTSEIDYNLFVHYFKLTK